MFNSNSFIAPYVNSDTALVFVNTVGTRVRGINVCKYLDSGVKENILWILMEGGSKLEFAFQTNADASLAALKLFNALNTLQANCDLGGGSPSPEPIPESIVITYDNYKELVNNNQTVPLQYYDIVDSNNILGKGVGQIYRCIALNSSDAYPQGIVLTTGDKAIINFNINKFSDEIILEKNIITFNKSTVSSDEYSNYIFSLNNSSITSVASDYIYAYNSTVNVSDCQNITCNNSTVTIRNSVNCIFKNVTVNLANLGTFNNIEVSDISSGKEGVVTLDVATIDDSVLLAYKDFKIQKLAGTLTENKTLLIKNLPTDNPVGAEFEFILQPDIILGNYEISIIDFSSNTELIKINSSYIDSTIIIKYDRELEQFYLFKNKTSKQEKTVITVLANNQINFSNVLSFIPQLPANSLLVINGQLQNYGVDYTITNKSLSWISSDFNLSTTDKIYIIYQ